MSGYINSVKINFACFFLVINVPVRKFEVPCVAYVVVLLHLLICTCCALALESAVSPRIPGFLVENGVQKPRPGCCVYVVLSG